MTTSNSEPAASTEVTYRGNCHCGAFVYEATLPEIKSATQCNCSICTKKNYLLVYTSDPNKFKVVKGSEDDLATYSFAGKKLAHKFCPTCATPVMARMGDFVALNVRAMQGMNIWDLEKKPYDGTALGDPYQDHEYKGPLPKPVEGGRLYSGSCHCGAVTLGVMSKPIDETYEANVCDCNCSICTRNGYLWIYPQKDEVELHAEDPANIGRYNFNQYAFTKIFCKICGVNVSNKESGLTQEERNAMGAAPPNGTAEYMKAWHPINVRVLSDVDLNKVKTKFFCEGAKVIEPLYVNP